MLRYLSVFVFAVSVIACSGNDGTTPNDASDSDNQSGGDDDSGGDLGLAPLTATADSITVTQAAGRVDPEGIAPTPASVNVVSWKDARHGDRTVTLGAHLYQYDFTFDDGQTTVTRSAGDDAYGHPGFGYVVSHNTVNGNSPLGKANAASSATTTVFSGGHHAVHRVELTYARDVEGGGNGIEIPVVITWLLATGRDHPVWAVTWKVGESSNPNAVDFDTYRMDTRAPYGSLLFDGATSKDASDTIGGVAWGDFAYRFATTSTPLNLNTSWTYNTANDVAYTQTWTQSVNAEMGIVQTRLGDDTMGYPDRVLGRERGSTSSGDFDQKANCNDFGDARVYAMPCINGWPYQLQNYDWFDKPVGEATSTTLIAWGTQYGWLGASTVDNFDYSRQYSGAGDRAYATFIVLGPKCRYSGGVCNQSGDVALAVAETQALAAATLSAVTAGSVATSAPTGPGAASSKTLANGYDDTYAAHIVEAASNHVAFTLTPEAGKPLHNPVIAVRGYTSGLPAVEVDGVSVSVNTGAADAGAWVSLDTASGTLWVTVHATLVAATTIDIRG